MTPTIGRIVHFRLSASQAAEINEARSNIHPGGHERTQKHMGNSVAEGTVVPLVVTQVWPTEYQGGWLAHHEPGTKYESPVGVNGQALLDGNDSLWVCSAPQSATLPGCWFWPPKN